MRLIGSPVWLPIQDHKPLTRSGTGRASCPYVWGRRGGRDRAPPGGRDRIPARRP
jgi:hypothetical protein